MGFVHKGKLRGFHIDINQVSLFLRKMEGKPLRIHIMVFDKRRRLYLGKDIASEGNAVPGIANREDKNKKADRKV